MHQLAPFFQDRLDGPRYIYHRFREAYYSTYEPSLMACTARALCLSEPGDIIILPRPLRPEFDAILEHYDAIGLSHTQYAWWIDQHSGHEIGRRIPSTHPFDVFSFDESVHQVRPNARRLQATRDYDDKNWFIAYCQNQDWPAPPTEFYEAGTLPQTTRLNLPIFVKAVSATGGSLVFCCHNWSEVIAAARKMPGRYQLQEGVPASDFLSSHYHIRQGEITFIGLASQLLEGTRNSGHQAPCPADVQAVRSITDPLASQAAADGIEGFIAFDLALTPNEATYVKILECNPRYTGATYPLAIAAKLDVSQWMTLKVPTPAGRLPSQRELATLQYNPATKTGVVLMVWGVPHRFYVFIAGPPDVQTDYSQALSALLQQ